ncbi:hypothetical protein [Kordiimonas sp.]|uniref:hypothetical protein n=1 Tax=Kordiimonas sp. TaxID=1970157 RepID=UPI003A94A762
MKQSTTILILAALSSAAFTSGTLYAQAGDEERYGACVTLAERVPDKAINIALAWQAEEGGVPARHCEALALFHLKEYAEAAARMMKIADDMRVGKEMPVRGGKRLVANAGLLADMYGQAANAWLLADEIVRAEDAIEVALALVPHGSSQGRELMVDRARIAAADQDYELALQDLEAVLQLDTNRTDILVLIASAARGVGNFGRADEALKAYFKSYPDSPAGLLELGNLRHAEGKPDEARTAWIKLLVASEQGPEAEAARLNLEKLDLQVEDDATKGNE